MTKFFTLTDGKSKISLVKFRGRYLSPLLALTLAGCFRNSDEVTQDFTINKVGLSGPLVDAIAFLDENGNRTLDEGEVFDRTNAEDATDPENVIEAGSFTLVATTDAQRAADVVVISDAKTIDTSTGVSPGDIVFVANQSADGVVTPMTTMIVEGGISKEDLAAAFGFDPSVVDLTTFNPFASDLTADQQLQAENVESAAKQVVGMLRTIATMAEAAGVGASADGRDLSLSIAIDAVASQLKAASVAGEVIDFSDADGEALNEFLEGAVSSAVLAVANVDGTTALDAEFTAALVSSMANVAAYIDTLDISLTEVNTELSVLQALEANVVSGVSGGDMTLAEDGVNVGEIAQSVAPSDLSAAAVSGSLFVEVDGVDGLQLSAKLVSAVQVGDSVASVSAVAGGDADLSFSVVPFSGRDSAYVEVDPSTGAVTLTAAGVSALQADGSEGFDFSVEVIDGLGKYVIESFSVAVSETLGVHVFVNETSSKTYDTLQDAIADSAAGDVLLMPSGEISDDVVLDKSLTLKGAHSGTAAATWGVDGIPTNFDPSGRGEETVITGSIIISDNVTDVTIDGLYINPSDDGAPLQLGSGVDGLSVENSFLTGYDAGALQLSAISNLTLSNNLIGGVTTANTNGGSLYLTDIDTGDIDGNLFWRPGAAHLYLENMSDVGLTGNNFYHGLHAGGADFDGLLDQAPSGSGSGYGSSGYGSSGYGSSGYGSSGYGSSGYGSSGYGSGQGADGVMYGRNYWLEVKGVNSDLTIDGNVGNFNSGGIQVYGEQEGASFTNLSITDNVMGNFVNADPDGSLLDQDTRHLSGNMGGIAISIDEALASATNVVITGNTISGAADQVLSNQDVNALIQIAGDITGLDVSNNTLTWSNSSDIELSSIDKNFSDDDLEGLIGIQIVGGVDGASDESPVEIGGNTISFAYAEIDKFVGNGLFIGDDLVDEGNVSPYGEFSGKVVVGHDNVGTASDGIDPAGIVVTSDKVLETLTVEFTDPNSYLTVYILEESGDTVSIVPFTIEDDTADTSVAVYENVGFTVQLTGTDNVSVTENGGENLIASGTISATAIVASDESILIEVSNEQTSFGSATYDAASDGWTYTLADNDTVDGLTPESSQTDTITFTITRGDVVVTETATVNIQGVEDPLVVSFDQTSAAIDLSADQGTSATFTASVSDKDNAIDGGVWTFEDPTYGTLVENDGVFTYTADNSIAETRALASTDTQTETISLTFTNGDDVESTDVAIAITGKDEPELFTVQSVVDTGSVAQVEIIINGDAIVDSIAGASSSSSIRGVDFSITPLSSGVVVDGVTVAFQAADRMDWYDADDLFTTWTDEQDKFRETSLYTAVVGETIAIGDTQPFVNSTGTYSREMDGTTFDFSEFVGTDFVLGKLTFRDFPEDTTPSDFDIEVSGTVVTMDEELSFTTSTVDII